MIIYFNWDGLNVMKIVNEVLFSKDFVYKCNTSLNMSHIIGVLNCSS